MLGARKVRRLRKALRTNSNSEAVRRVIDERLAVEGGLKALRSLNGLEVRMTYRKAQPLHVPYEAWLSRAGAGW